MPTVKPDPVDIGTVLRSTVTITDLHGALVDPSTLVCVVRDPAGTKTTYTYGVDVALVRDGVGVYHVDVDTSSLPGRWFVRFQGRGSNAGAQDRQFIVSQTPTT